MTAQTNSFEARQRIDQKVMAAQEATDPVIRDEIFAAALDMTSALMEHDGNSGYNAFRHILGAARSPHPLPATTQAAINCFQNYIASGKGPHQTDMADLLAGHATFRFREREAVINALIDSLPVMVRVLKNSAIPYLTRQATELAKDDQTLFEKAVKASWATIPRIAPDNSHIAYEIIYTLYGTARGFRTEEKDSGLEEFITGGRSAMQDIVRDNRRCAIMAAEAIEMAAREILYGKKHGLYSPISSTHEDMSSKNYCTPEFVRIGGFQPQSGKKPGHGNRWLFPIKSGDNVTIVTMIRGAFAHAALDDGSVLSKHGKDMIQNARNQFERAVKGEIPVTEAAKRIGSSLSHFNLDTYK